MKQTLTKLHQRRAKWRKSLLKIVLKTLILVKQLKILYASDHTIWFKFREHMVQIRIK